MSRAAIVEFGASILNSKSGQVFAQAKGEGPPEDRRDYGEIPMMNCLGVVSRPAPATAKGEAQGIVVSVVGFDAVCVGATDVRTTDMAGDLEAGDTAILGTSEKHKCRTVYKEERVVTMVGDDMVIDIDRKAKHLLLSAFKSSIEISEKGGIVLRSGGATFQLKGGQIICEGKVMLGSRKAKNQILCWPASPLPQVPIGGGPTNPPTMVPVGSGVYIG